MVIGEHTDEFENLLLASRATNTDGIRKELGSGHLCVTGENAGPAVGGVKNGVHLVGTRTIGFSKSTMFELDASALPTLCKESNLNLTVQGGVVAPLRGDLPVEKKV